MHLHHIPVEDVTDLLRWK